MKDIYFTIVRDVFGIEQLYIVPEADDCIDPKLDEALTVLGFYESAETVYESSEPFNGNELTELLKPFGFNMIPSVPEK